MIQSDPDLMESTRWSLVNNLVSSCTCAQIWPARPDPSCLCAPLVHEIHGRRSLRTAPKIDNLMVRSRFQTDPSLAFHSPDAFRGRRTAIRKPQEGEKGSKSVIGYLFFCRSFGIWFDLGWLSRKRDRFFFNPFLCCVPCGSFYDALLFFVAWIADSIVAPRLRLPPVCRRRPHLRPSKQFRIARVSQF